MSTASPPVPPRPVPAIASRDPHALLAAATALSMAVAAGLHLAALPTHAREGAGVAIFFAATALLQFAAAAVLSAGPGRRARLGIAAGNVALIGLWLVSRTVGLPLGPHAGVAEAVSVLDTLAVIAEVIALGGVALLGRTPADRAGRAARVPVLVVAALVVGVVGTGWADPSHSHKPAGVAPHDHDAGDHHRGHP